MVRWSWNSSVSKSILRFRMVLPTTPESEAIMPAVHATLTSRPVPPMAVVEVPNVLSVSDAVAIYAIALGADGVLLASDPDRATELANATREQVSSIDEVVRTVDEQLRDLEPRQAQQLGLVVDSLSRTADYGGNIAESALQKAAPRP